MTALSALLWTLSLAQVPASPAPVTDPGPLWHAQPAGAAVRATMPSLSPLVKAVKGAVVNVEVANGRGSGFLIDPRGWILTNAHVLGGSTEVKIRLADGVPLAAQVVGRDDGTDIALLKLVQPAGAPLPYAYLGDSDQLEVGDWVVAIGNPFGLTKSVSQGILSAKERVLGLGPFDDFLQTDVLINPGTSGGPVFDLRGQVVGVTTARVSEGQGIGFALPINLVKDLLPQLVSRGHVTRGWLGLNVEQVTEPGAHGTVVKDVVIGGPASLAGLQKDDRILAVEGKPVESYVGLLRRVALSPPGTRLRIQFERGKTTHEVNVIIAELPARH